ncbi:GH32 C-terminal domain-containing protein [Paenibacillus alkaliterrae]|uniref:GH32 C-terminal domain-containing protein n=1 Tax=Paenibacillus alkaliterrae TaxID=320909 RepID=UPI0038B276B5
MDGRSGSAAENAVFMSDETGDHFVYTSSVKLTGNEGVGTASLLFRSDADAGNGYYAQLDASGGKVKLLKASKGVMNVLAEKEMAVVPDRLYRIKVDADGSSIKMYVDDKLMLEANDAAFSSGHFGLSFSRVSAVFQDVNRMKTIKTNEKEIANHDFETGDLTGWHAIHGNAFTDDHVSDKAAYWGGPFGQQGSHHLWGFSDLHKGDEAAGELHSSYFRLSGSGEINFLMGGGNDIDNLYVSLVRASDDQELIRQTNTKFNEEKYQQYIWDASRYIGEVLYLKVVDKAAGSWGHLNLDDVRVYNEGPMAEEVDQVASEPVSGQKRLSGVLTDWSAVAGQWIPSTNGSNGGIWECPTLIELPIDGDPNKTKWVLLVSINDGAPAGGSGMQYYVGSFDGTTFTNDNPSDKVLWVDYGADFYAAVDWSDIAGKNGERYWLGWMSNWQYANHTPTSTWRGAMTLPRSMELTDTDEGLRLKQTPVSLESIRDKRAKVSLSNETISGHSSLLSNVSEDTFELIAEFEQTDPKVTEFGFQVRKGAEDYTTVGYDAAYGQLFIDRGNSGAFDFGANVAGRHKGPMNMTNGTVKMHIFVDRSSVEVFGNIGETVITDQIFPDPESNGITIYSEGGEVTLKSLELYPLKSIWSK